jgi:hypothetical protein
MVQDRFSGKLAIAIALTSSLGVPAGQALAGDPPAPAGDRAAARAERPKPSPLVLRAGPVAGTLVGLDGVSPVARARVVLRDAKGTLVAEATSGADGRFDLGPREAGEYTLEVGRAVGVVKLAADLAPKDLLLVIAPEVAQAIRGAEGEETISILGIEMEESTAIGVGIGAVLLQAGGIAAIAVGASESGGGGGSSVGTEPPPSPSQP